jgi:hypothetical protein
MVQTDMKVWSAAVHGVRGRPCVAVRGRRACVEVVVQERGGDGGRRNGDTSPSTAW